MTTTRTLRRSNAVSNLHCFIKNLSLEDKKDILDLLEEEIEKEQQKQEVVLNEDLTCSICLDHIEENCLKRTSCGHNFHICCIDRWCALNNSCPQCRLFNPFEETTCLPVYNEYIINNIHNDISRTNNNINNINYINNTYNIINFNNYNNYFNQEIHGISDNDNLNNRDVY